MQYITDIIRKNVYETINSGMILLALASRLFAYEDGNINFEILLIDYYNSLMIKKRMNTLDDDDIKFLELVNNNKVEDLRWLTTNRHFVKNALIATINFENLALLDKQQITKVAYEEKDENDLTKRLLYIVNYIANTPSYNRTEILNYYKEYIKINGSDLITHDNGRDIIYKYIKDMRVNDYDNYKNNVLSAAKAYYKFGKYLMKEENEKLDTISKIFLKRIEYLKIDKLMQMLNYDDNFLVDVITQYLYYETLPKDLIQKIEEFSDKKLSKRMKEKFDNMK